MPISIPSSTTSIKTSVNRTVERVTNFKDLEHRFLEKMNTLYGLNSTKDLADGQHGVEPYRETKPNDSNLPNFGGPRTLSGDSIGADIVRLTKFSIHKPFWYLDQQNLQSGNTFTETRIINPLFVIGSAQPYIHIKRPLTDALNMDLGGEGSHPGSPNNIGAAGRLQKTTSKNIVNLLTTGANRSIWNSLARIAPPNRVFNTISMVANVISDIGPIEINQRPEMDMGADGKFDRLFSIESWKTEAYGGFVRTDTPVNALARIGSSLRKGKIKAAGQILAANTWNNPSVDRFISNPFAKTSQDVPGVLEKDDTNRTQRSMPGYKFEGKRYFITSIKSTDYDLQADRYLKDTVMTVNEHTAGGDYNWTSAILNLDNTPSTFSEPIFTVTDRRVLNIPSRRTPNVDETPAQAAVSSADRTRTVVNNASRAAIDRTNQTNTVVVKGPAAARAMLSSQASQLMGRNAQTRLASAAANQSSTGGTEEPNPAETKMLFKELSLRQTYINDERYNEIRNTLDGQQEKWLATLRAVRSTNPNMKGAGGYGGGISIDGNPVAIIPNAKNPLTISAVDANDNPRYFFDDINSYPVVASQRADGYLTKEAMDAMKVVHGTPLVDLYFFDFVNKVAIPFRANIENLSETVNPEYTDNFYIGRTERNIIYTGVKRELNLSWTIHAFNELELTGIWAKINYLTSLCFPARYSRGFMVPPLVKLTLGDVYNNQPGYIKSLSYTVDSDTPWEITEPFQVPHGIKVSMAFSVIEKVAQNARKFINYNPLSPENNFVPLYGYGIPRMAEPIPVTPETPRTPSSPPPPGCPPYTPPSTAIPPIPIPTFPRITRPPARLGSVTSGTGPGDPHSVGSQSTQ